MYGIFFLLSYFAFNLKNFYKNLKEERTEILLGFLLIPLGLTCFMLFSFFKTGDTLAILHIQNVAWNHPVVNPIARIVENITTRSDAHGVYNLIPYFAAIGIVAIIVSLFLPRKKI